MSSSLMSPLRCTGMKSSPTSSSTERICSGKNTVDSVWKGKRENETVREKKKRVMICITICKNPQCIRPSRTNTGFCSGSALASCSWHFPFIFFLFHWSGGPAVCLFIFENNSPSVFWFGVTRRALQRDRFGSFSSCLTYRGQLHRQESEFIPQSQSAGSFTRLQLHTQRGQSSLSYFLPRLSLRLWLEFVIEGETLS